MRWTADRLSVEVSSKGCDIPSDERARIQPAIAALGGAVRDFADPTLGVNVVYHPRSRVYHVESELKLPGRSLSAGLEDSDLGTALRRCLARLTWKAEAYAEYPERGTAAERLSASDLDIIAPEDPAAGPLAAAALEGDYRTFRTALAGYEEWLRTRVGRLVQRHPEAQAQVGTGLLLGDVVEEVYLDAFERFTRRPTEVPLGVWLEGLIEPAIRALMRHPEEERAAASFARTVRQAPLG